MPQLEILILFIPVGSRYPSMKYMRQAMFALPSTETLDTPYLGTLDPWGFASSRERSFVHLSHEAFNPISKNESCR